MNTQTQTDRISFRIEPSLKNAFFRVLNERNAKATDILTDCIERYIRKDDHNEDKISVNEDSPPASNELIENKEVCCTPNELNDMQRVLLEIESLKLRVKLLELDK